MPELTLRLAGEVDAPALAELMIEMQAHYNSSRPPRAELDARLRRLPSGAEIMLAERDGRLAGFAAFSAIFPGPDLVGGFFLKELYVSAADRSAGVGLALMAALAALAEARGLGRIDWTVGKDNLAAIEFYDRLGGQAQDDRHFYRLTGSALAALGARSTSDR